jgi:hypothetical protein
MHSCCTLQGGGGGGGGTRQHEQHELGKKLSRCETESLFYSSA